MKCTLCGFENRDGVYNFEGTVIEMTGDVIIELFGVPILITLHSYIAMDKIRRFEGLS